MAEAELSGLRLNSAVSKRAGLSATPSAFSREGHVSCNFPAQDYERSVFSALFSSLSPRPNAGSAAAFAEQGSTVDGCFAQFLLDPQ